MQNTETDAEAQKKDRSTWGSGPWDNEPDRVDFRAAGYACLLNRGGGGAWCGYVAMPPGHPLHGSGYDAVHDTIENLSVHGGLTYADKCRGSICHVPAPGEPDDVWWLGFDCAHADDLIPRTSGLYKDNAFSALLGARGVNRDVYRDVAYARRETEALAVQIAVWTLTQRA